MVVKYVLSLLHQTNETIMTTYKVTSAKDQGVYSKGELIRNIKTNNIAEYFGLEHDKAFNLESINTCNGYEVKINQSN